MVGDPGTTRQVRGPLVGPEGDFELDPGVYYVRVHITSNSEFPVFIVGTLRIT